MSMTNYDSEAEKYVEYGKTLWSCIKKDGKLFLEALGYDDITSMTVKQLEIIFSLMGHALVASDINTRCLGIIIPNKKKHARFLRISKFKTKHFSFNS